MASFVYAIWSIASVHCSVRPEISPCTCEPLYTTNRVELSCEKVDSFNQIVDALSGKFSSNLSISLQISHSQLDDLEMRSFTEMKLNMIKLRMISDNLRSVPELPFRGLSNLEYLSFAENDLDEIPKHVLNHLPKILTLDLGKGRIKAVMQDDFKGISKARYLILVSNNITRLDKGSFPLGLSSLHLGRNQITNLNGTLRDLHDLESLFINMNNIQTLDNELPASPNLKLILAQNNSLERLPQSMKQMPNLDSLFFQNNKLKALDGVLMNAKKLKEVKAFHNQIEYLARDEFLEAEYLEVLDLAFNNIKSLNSSLLPMKRLSTANFSFNEMDEFSMNEIRGLEYLKSLDISYNKIQKLTGRQENLIDQHSFLVEFNLHHNRLKSLDGALMGLNKLRILSLTHNQIERILPDDFIGLESLEILDLSHNQLLTLEETSTTVLPSLKIIKVAYNNLTKLEKDFHGLPVLCQAHLMHNQITSVSTDLVSKTKCSNHGVPGKLEIWLENNPIMCDDERVNELCPIMASQEARIRGKSQCYENDREVCADPPIILQAQLSENLPLIIQQQLSQKSSNGSPLVQVIVPAPHHFSKPLKKMEILPPIVAPIATSYIKALPALPTMTTTITTTTTTTIPPTTSATTTTTSTSTTSTTPPATTAETILSSTTPAIITTTATNTAAVSTTTSTPIEIQFTTPQAAASAMKMSVDVPLLHSADIQTDYPTVEYIPLLEDNPDHSSFPDGEDNSVHEEYSPVVITGLDDSQRILVPEEPPETP